LFVDAQQELQGKPKTLPVYAELARRVPERLSDVRLGLALVASRRWHETRDPAEMRVVGRYLQLVRPSSPDAEYAAAILRATHRFVHEHDVKGAVEVLRKCKLNPDGNRQYSLGFLYAYAGDLDSAYRCYRNGNKYPIEGPAIAQIEQFIEWVLQEEPARYQLHWCLGYINWHVKGDGQRAEEEFTEFLSSGPEGQFARQRALAHQWLSEMKHTSRGASVYSPSCPPTQSPGSAAPSSSSPAVPS
jgi:hypothetical protein